jgi:kanamycin kinase
VTSGFVQAPDRQVDASEVPAIVAELAAGAPITWVWHNEIGGRTYRIVRDTRTEYVKWAPDHPEADLDLESQKLRWARRFIPVPEVIAVGRDSETTNWMHTVAIDASSAVAAEWKAQPRTAARAIGTGLRTLHDQLPLAECPWSWRIADRATMITKPEDRVLLDVAPPEDDLVVCHGDACSPNTLIAADGRYAGHVDLGQLGVADRWADLAVATYALDWNYTPACQDELLDAYGIGADRDRIDFYRRLWDAA